MWISTGRCQRTEQGIWPAGPDRSGLGAGFPGPGRSALRIALGARSEAGCVRRCGLQVSTRVLGAPAELR